MHFRSILSGTLAVLLLSGAGASARDGGLLNRLEADTGGFSLKLPKLGLPGVFGEKREQAAQGVQVAQSGGTAELQDQIRGDSKAKVRTPMAMTMAQNRVLASSQVSRRLPDSGFAITCCFRSGFSMRRGLLGGSGGSSHPPCGKSSRAGDSGPADPSGPL